MVRVRSVVASLVAWCARALLVVTPLAAQEAGPAPLVNGDMEALDQEGRLLGWRVPSSLSEAGYVIGPADAEPFAGERAAQLDSRPVTPGANAFGNLSQTLDATGWRGKRVRFRAMVRVAADDGGARAQLWLRVDRALAGAAPRMGFFDNMGDRPITSSKWQPYEIVGDVADDAQSIVLGVLCFGQGLVLVDDARVEEVPEEVATTGGKDAFDTPPQPLFTPWLWLVPLALGGFALAFHARGAPGKLALVFTGAYWLLYGGTTLGQNLVPFFGARWSLALESGPIDGLVRWTARSVLGIEGELVSSLQNGSGDTTFAYVQGLVTLVLAAAAALVFGGAWARATRASPAAPRARDVLRSGLRYYLAIYLVGYGLAKLGTLSNQFSAPGTWRLTQPYGDSSPMGLLWTFMGSSRAYTYFAGASELLGGLLLLSRRTTLLGALVGFGVMLNVMLMNFCYDVPVKLFSAHLVVCAALVALPDFGRLAQLFLGFGAGASATLASPFRGRAGKWLHCVARVYLVVMVAGIPLWGHWRYERAVAPVRAALGEWKLATLALDGALATPAAGEVEWLTLPPRLMPGETSTHSLTYQAALVGGAAASASAMLTPELLTFTAGPDSKSRILPGEFTWTVENDELHLTSPTVKATFRPATHEHLLMRRGFRWINEVPYNR